MREEREVYRCEVASEGRAFLGEKAARRVDPSSAPLRRRRGAHLAPLPRDRLLSVNAENDPSAARVTMDALAGFASDRCAADAVTCLRDNRSGWILVRQEDLADPAPREPGHCWFDRDSCGAGALALEPNWVDPASDKAFALERNADWLASMVRGAAGP